MHVPASIDKNASMALHLEFCWHLLNHQCTKQEKHHNGTKRRRICDSPDPVAHYDLDAIGELSRRLDTPLCMSDQNTLQFFDGAHLIRTQSDSYGLLPPSWASPSRTAP